MYTLGVVDYALERRVQRMRDERVIERILRRDHTLWQPDPKECADRLGWLDAPGGSGTDLALIESLSNELCSENYQQALLLGMGGSSLAPQMFKAIFGAQPGRPDLAVLDTTDPAAVLAWAERIDPARTLLIVSTKSGGTVETMSLFKYFYNLLLDRLGKTAAGRHCVAITDQGSSLHKLAQELGLRAWLPGDPQVGGRYSALTAFGLFPAQLLGMDISRLLAAAATAREDLAAGAHLGAALGELALAGRDKLTLLISAELAPFGAWLEQLIAESTGKHGIGILPVVDEPIVPVDLYGVDRAFVRLRLAADSTHDRLCAELAAAGHPLIDLALVDPYDLGAQIYTWELATAVAGYVIEVNPFDQPDVESAKHLARALTADLAAGRLLPQDDALAGPLVRLSEAPPALLDALAAIPEHGYVALQAFIDPTPAAAALLERLRERILRRFQIATSANFGPRYLHSTGQLHKGGPAGGLFVQLLADDAADAAIPDQLGNDRSSLSFGSLKAAQALGDAQALARCDRRILRVHLGRDPLAGLEQLIAAF